MDNIPKKRRRILVTTLLIDQIGQYEALPIRLPANAGRITGIMVTANQQGKILDGFSGWVVYGDPGLVPGPVLERWKDAVLYNRLPTGINRLGNDVTSREGFHALLSDELPLTLLRPAPGGAIYMFFHKILGTPVFTNALGQTVNVAKPPTQQFAQDKAYRNSQIMAYELPVDTAVFFPPTFIL